MKIDHSVIKLYLQRQDKYLTQKFTELILRMLSSQMLFWMFVVMILDIMFLTIKPERLNADVHFWLVCVAVGIPMAYGFCFMFLTGRLPYLKPLFNAYNIQHLCDETIDTYTKMALPDDVPRSGINYLNDIISKGVPMNYLHGKIVKKMIKEDTENLVMKNSPTDIKPYLQRQDNYLAKKLTDFMLELFSPQPLVMSFIVIVMGSMLLITKPAILSETEQTTYHWFAIAIGGIFGGYGFGALFFLCWIPKLKPLLSATYIQALRNETTKTYDEMELPVDFPRSGLNYLDELISKDTPMNYSHENAINELIAKDKLDQEINILSEKMAKQGGFQ